MEYDRRDFYNVVHFELYGYPGRKKNNGDATNAAFDDDEEAAVAAGTTVNKFVNFGMKQLENFGSAAANATEAAMSRGKELSTKVIPGTQGTSVAMTARPVPVNTGRIRPATIDGTRERYGLQIGLACVVTWCCNPPFGLTAFILAMLASKFSSDNKSIARRLARASMGIAIIGIVVSAVAVSLGIGIYYGYLDKQCSRIINGDCYYRYSK